MLPDADAGVLTFHVACFHAWLAELVLLENHHSCHNLVAQGGVRYEAG
jgi:hypothetical protein